MWHEGFESDSVGLNWAPTRGLWQIGTPTVGPTNVLAGQRCAATGLDRDYPNNASSSLASPSVLIPEASERPRLRFWHWFRIYPDNDYGQVLVRLEDGTEEAISPRYVYSAADWSPAELDLSKHAGRRVQFLFHCASDGQTSWSGWFIDEVELVTGGRLFGGFEDFEGGWGDWSTHRGNWAVGKPEIGPPSAFSGTHCAGVVLRGESYPNGASSYLVSPPIALPTASREPRLRFWHWFRVYPDNDYAQVWIRLEDGSEEAISPKYFYSADDWSPVELALTKYAGRTVQLLFYFASDGQTAWQGWFIDDIEIVTRPAVDLMTGTEGFEHGWGDWSAYRGNWSIGTPQLGPKAAFAGDRCAGVVLKGDAYPNGTSTYLVSPRYLIPDAAQNPRLNFQHWFQIYPDGDYGQVWVRLEDGTEEALSPDQYSGDSGGWSSALLPLSKYAGKTVRFLFYFASNGQTAWPGWFIDDVRILPAIRNNRPIFDSVPPQIALVGTPLEFTVTANDKDAGQKLTYALDTNSAPAAATFDPITRKFSWTPSLEPSGAPGGRLIFYVRDDGQPSLRDVLVVPVLLSAADAVAGSGDQRIAPSLVLSDRPSYEGWSFWLIGALPGFQYTVQSSPDLRIWSDLISGWTPRGEGHMPRVAGPVLPSEGTRLFYRVRAQVAGR